MTWTDLDQKHTLQNDHRKGSVSLILELKDDLGFTISTPKSNLLTYTNGPVSYSVRFLTHFLPRTRLSRKSPLSPGDLPGLLGLFVPFLVLCQHLLGSYLLLRVSFICGVKAL